MKDKKGKGLHYSSLFYYYFMIKNRIKRYNFSTNSVSNFYTDSLLERLGAIRVENNFSIFTRLNNIINPNTVVDAFTVDTTADTNTLAVNLEQQYPTTWQVNLGGNERLVLDNNGDMRITGRIHALGSVIYNQETNQLNFWNGTEWLPFGPNMI